ncbi:hypothetical protein TNCV_3663881 [Trichonephila clavipes]|nr:hypothetical protein TNCV_3663881 [Trichonephila clavipes]
MSEGRFDLSTFRSERTNEASTLTITPKRSSSRDVGSPVIAPLPDIRATESFPFADVGIDFEGPLFVKDSDANSIYC